MKKPKPTAKTAKPQQPDAKPQPEPGKPINDPANYARLNVPFERLEELQVAIQAFTADVRRLRQEYGLPDVYVIVRGSYMKDEVNKADPEDILTTFHCGSSGKTLYMTAAAFGAEKKRHDEVLDELVNRTKHE